MKGLSKREKKIVDKAYAMGYREAFRYGRCSSDKEIYERCAKAALREEKGK